MKWVCGVIHVILFCKLALANGSKFESGEEYQYSYSTLTSLEEGDTLGSLGPVQYQIKGDVQLTCVWAQGKDYLLLVKLSQPKLSVKSDKFGKDGFATQVHSNIDALASQPFVAHLVAGKLEAVYFHEAEALDNKNLKKALTSVFQYQQTDGEREEEDVSGKCKVTYKGDGTVINKQKSDCVGFPVIQHHNKVLQGQLESQLKGVYHFNTNEAAPNTYKSEEQHTFRASVYQRVSTKATTSQELTRTGSSRSGATVSGGSVAEAISQIGKTYDVKLAKETLILQEHGVCTIEKCKNLKDVVAQKKQALEKTVSKEGANAFLAVQKAMKTTNKDNLIKVLKAQKSKGMLNSLVDALGACSTKTCHEAAMNMVDFSSSDIELAEQYLLSLSVASQPTEFHLKDLLTRLKNPIAEAKLKESVVLTVASLTNSFCKYTGDCPKQIVEDVKTYLTSSLTECDNPECRSTYLRGLRNLADPATIPLLLKFAEGSDKANGVLALRALYTMLPEHMSQEVKEALVRIFHQLRNKADLSARCMAAELLLMANPDSETLASLLRYLPERKENELNTYVMQRITDLSESNPELKSMLLNHLSNVRTGNYANLAQGGLSSAFSRGFYYDTRNGNSTFTSQLIITGGLLKRSTTDLDFITPNSALRMLSLVLYADGLGSLMGGEEEDEDAAMTAGMDLTFLDTQMRPFVFFTGQGELMGHVWSGTASDLTTALKGTVALHDSSVSIPLQSGFLLHLSLRSALAFHLEGKVELSLWYKNAKSLVKISSALKVENHASIDSTYIVESTKYEMNTENSLDFYTDVDFSDEAIMCLQMKQPTFQIRYKLNKEERIPGSKQVVKKSAKSKETVEGRTYKLNDKNTELCNQMFN